MSRSLTCAFVPYWSGNPYQDELARSLESHGIKVDRGTSLKAICRRALLCGHWPDIIHLHWLPAFRWSLAPALRLFLFLLRLCMLRMLGARLILTVHNLIPHESRSPRGDWLASRIVIAKAQAIIVHGEAARREVVSTFRLRTDTKKIFVIPHGNFIEAYDNHIERAIARARLGISDTTMTMLFLGNMRPYKGVSELIGAFRKLVDSGERAELVIAGRPLDEELSGALKAEAERCKAIRYEPRFVPDDEIQVYLNACDVAVFPYRQILSSGAVILAMSFARACIAPQLGCIQDVLDKDGAFLYDPRDERGLFDALTAACVHKEALRRMGEYNRRKAEHWSWDYVGSETKRVYLGDGAETPVGHASRRAV